MDTRMKRYHLSLLNTSQTKARLSKTKMQSFLPEPDIGFRTLNLLKTCSANRALLGLFPARSLERPRKLYLRLIIFLTMKFWMTTCQKFSEKDVFLNYQGILQTYASHLWRQHYTIMTSLHSRLISYQRVGLNFSTRFLSGFLSMLGNSHKSN